MAFRPHTRRRVLAAGVAGCLLVAVVDQAAPGATAPLRRAAAEVFSPVQSLLVGDGDAVTRLTRERDAALRAGGDARRNAQILDDLRRLRGSAPADGRSFIAARVIGYTTGTGAGVLQQVTIDVGSADGIRPGLTVIAVDGLVGRTIAVSSHAATVQLITDPASSVGVRVGERGMLASVSSTVPAGLATRAPGLLTVRIAGITQLRVGDRAATLGSIDQTPYVADVPVGTVIALDPDRGQGAPTAVLRPAVDLTRLDLVGVVLPTGRTGPRPSIVGHR